MACTNCQELPGGSTVIITEAQQPFCEQCSGGEICPEKLDSACVFYHLDLTKPNKLGNLGIGNGASAEQIFEAINDLVGNTNNIPIIVNSSHTLNLFTTGAAGHTLSGEVIVSTDEGNLIETRPTGIFVSDTNTGKVKINEDDPAAYLINQLVGGTDTIVSTSIIEDTGMLKIQPSIDIQCLLDKIRTEYLEAFCEVVSLCVASLPIVEQDCDNVEVTGTFVQGIPSSGSASIPVSVTGSGTITVSISGGGFYGSQTVAINPSTTSVNLTFNYDGSAPGGSRSVTFILSGVQGGFVSCPETILVGCDCDAVTSIVISNIGDDTAAVSWTAPVPAPSIGYTVTVKRSSDNGTVFSGSTISTSITATGLTAFTQYYVEIVTNCATGCNSSVAGGVGTNFTTASGENYHLNAAFNGSIDNVTGTGIPPLPPTGTNGSQDGVHTGMSGTYSVTLSGSFIPTDLKLTGYVDSVPVDCVAIAGAGIYNLTITATPSENVIIAIDSGVCV